MSSRSSNVRTNAEDPYQSAQWYLGAIGYTDLGGEYRGSGLHVGIWDDGIEKTHADLAANYNASLEYRVNGVALNPQGPAGSNTHGTAVAGIIAAVANNGIGTEGIANQATVTTLDVIGGTAANYLVQSISYMSTFDVTNNSWGWVNRYADDYGSAFFTNLDYAVDNGRAGLGTIVCNAAGNGFSTDRRDANTAEFNATRETVTVGAVTNLGYRAYYSQAGACLLVAAPSNGGTLGITTTDETGSAGYSTTDVTSSFGGTSAATPIVSGVATLMLDASGNSLGWRDVQTILAITADYTSGGFAENGGSLGTNQTDLWEINGADNVNGGGLAFSNDYGFGQVDAYEAVRLSEVWHLFGDAATSANEQSTSATSASAQTLSDGSGYTTYTLTVSQDIDLDYVNLQLGLTHTDVTELRVELISPDGTTSLLLTPGDQSAAAVGFSNRTWVFGSNEFRGEMSAGVWTIRVYDTVAGGGAGSVNSVNLTLYGSAASIDNVYHFTDSFQTMLAIDPTRSVIVDHDGGTDWLDFAAIKGVIDADLADRTVLMAGTALTIEASTLIEDIVSGDGDDILGGNSLDNQLVGMRGNDTLTGRGGDDSIDGGAGTDSVVFSGNWSDYEISAVDGGYLITDTRGIDGSDRVTNVETFVFANGSFDGNGLMVGSSVSTLTGSAAAETISGSTGVDFVTAMAGNDMILGSGGADRIDGGLGTDTVSYSASTAAVTVDLADASAQSGGDAAGDLLGNIENVTGSAYADTLSGTAAANVLNGGDGDDRLAGRGGADQLIGGNGTDTADYSASSAAVTVNLSSKGAQAGGDAAGDILTAIENVTGSAYDDRLTGTSLANVISGGDGNDVIAGGAGADTLIGGAGTDTADYSASKTGVTVDLLLATAQAGGDAAGDILSGFENITGSAVASVLRGDDGVNVITGGKGGDVIEGRGGADTLTGGSGTDILSYASSGDAVTVSLAALSASGGDATGDVFSGFEGITGSAGDDRLTGDGAGNVVDGGAGDDLLSDGLGTDTVTGGDGNDRLVWGGGADRFTGGAGTDTLDLTGFAAGVTVNLTSGTASQRNNKLTLSGVESVSGSGYADTITGSAAAADTVAAGAGDDVIQGLGGNDVIDGGEGADTAVFLGRRSAYAVELVDGAIVVTALDGSEATDIYTDIENFRFADGTLDATAVLTAVSREYFGTSRNDTLTGTDSGERIYGGSGNDVLRGGGGADVLDGGSGSDTADYSQSEEAVEIDRGTGDSEGGDAEGDSLTGIEAVRGSAFDDSLTGSAGADIFYGGEGDDSLADGLGNDLLKGEGGDDSLVWSGGTKDSFDGGTGEDTLDLTDLTAGATVSLASNKVSSGSNRLTLAAIEDVTGTGYADVIIGSSGANVIEGGAGNDTLTGGRGADVFVFSSDSGSDVITDFVRGSDLLAISGFTMDDLTISTTGGVTHVAFAGNDIALTGVGALDASDFRFS